jgi:hypothetical protein
MICAEPIAVIRNYDDLVDAIRRRIFALDTTFEAANDAAGLPDRYLAKILAAQRPKHFGPMSLTLMLQTLGVALIMVPVDDAELERVRARLAPRRYPLRPADRDQTPASTDAPACLYSG